ncbi:phage integrase N-terminal SAM-like domain-containing protein [Xanthomonas oryzae]|nr:phage integrase N-terminal SAM-like domain-containing protein [Xanthomonas oryzae]ACD58688.1 site-specific recombinase [Xanthomonas oryzae pv. oryzae PXO99A]AWK18645.1 recombinase [Xanthomonas oryzae pv. oryzae]AXI17288.1 recombinase [Xanthomonas oryzae pv. oryzae]AXI21772.1 recombinase [Xanthomonas oryzae pv. oryzae]AXM09953.1 recombinase [Xanthomonas oryzae pv. oryzae]
MNYTPGDGGVTVRSGPKLLDQVRNRLRVLHYSLCTEQAYLSWIRRFILASGKHYLVQLGQMEVEAFFTRLAIQAKASAGTQNQALAALLFLSSDVLRLDRHHVSDEISRVQDLESWRHSA